ncbi:3-phosphoserine/phosphohydroxythreonine transaminase [Prosthecochloris sp. GSB1]|uniref:3-phosphoserine/phosphohydroxythreonine transaminase n=1 Tax=Prosthecochloris sp. GSB1 TaxID=281093 RepID=UPI00142DAF44|nr:3-phosphoserine/phosphohydroxythreonine transaminase [Prosthecochloris sp. GSB1]
MTQYPSNFYAGPGKLPESVLLRIRDELTDYRGTGFSVMEISHRAQPVLDLIERTEEKLRALMGLPADDAVLFLQGGGSLQFLMVPMNLSAASDPVDYVDTGYWAAKAVDAARSLDRDVHVAGRNHCAIPSRLDIRPDARYLHLCTNNTVAGTQWREFPLSPVPLVADMSSDILSRSIDHGRFALIYAHAQKTIGVAGVTVVILSRKTLETIRPGLPPFFDYRTHVEARSNYHTPPVFAIYVVECMLDWIAGEIGGLPALETLNNHKAALLYETLDASRLFHCPVPSGSRSKMNVVFETVDPKIEPFFRREASAAGLLGLEGHRSRGGFRASIYNPVTLSDVEQLNGFIADFEKRYG